MTAPGKTLEDFLGEAYALVHGVKEGDAEALVAKLVASEITTAELAELRDTLRQVEGRCVVSRTSRAFLDRVLSGREFA